jgi:hypothetical protein
MWLVFFSISSCDSMITKVDLLLLDVMIGNVSFYGKRMVAELPLNAGFVLSRSGAQIIQHSMVFILLAKT